MSGHTTSHIAPVAFKGSVATLEDEAVKGQILSAALATLKSRPGFNPAAISIVFGLKW